MRKLIVWALLCTGVATAAAQPHAAGYVRLEIVKETTHKG